jgi:hypothetical protein
MHVQTFFLLYHILLKKNFKIEASLLTQEDNIEERKIDSFYSPNQFEKIFFTLFVGICELSKGKRCSMTDIIGSN